MFLRSEQKSCRQLTLTPTWRQRMEACCGQWINDQSLPVVRTACPLHLDCFQWWTFLSAFGRFYKLLTAKNKKQKSNYSQVHSPLFPGIISYWTILQLPPNTSVGTDQKLHLSCIDCVRIWCSHYPCFYPWSLILSAGRFGCRSTEKLQKYHNSFK